MICWPGGPRKYYETSIPVVKPLTGVTVVVTRPVHQSETLCQLIESSGGFPLRFPTLEIGEPGDPAALLKILENIDRFDIAIFISPNAVEWGLKFVRQTGALPVHLKVAAVGKGTAKKLAANGIAVDIFPAQQFNSEALLALDPLQQVADQRILIFRGEGGRELLADTLRARGASVEYAECYQRLLPDNDSAELSGPLAQGKVNIITVTSNEALQNLYDMIGSDYRQYLLKLPLIVVSDRGQQLALELGFKGSVIVAANASDQSLLDAIIEWKTGQIH